MLSSTKDSQLLTQDQDLESQCVVETETGLEQS